MSGVFVPELNIGRDWLGCRGWLGYLAYSAAVLFSRVEKAFGRDGEAVLNASSDSDSNSVSSFKALSVQENAARLLDMYGDSVLRLAYSYLHNMQDAEDILQETLIRYMRAKPEFENNTHARSWLLRVAANLSKNRIEYNRYRMADELNEELVAEEREDLSYVWEAVKSLPPTYREAIHLFYQEGYQTAQIAEILGEKESTVRSHLKRGREKLREILKEAYDFEQ